MRTFARTPVTAPTASVAESVSAVRPLSGRRRQETGNGSSRPVIAFAFGQVPVHPSTSTNDIQRLAREGVAGQPGPLPHFARIQRSFGPAHDLAPVTARVGGRAADAARRMGAAAYASGERVAFAAAPSLSVAAHEAAHVVQQRAGVRLPGGVGGAGDAFERNADAVAGRVVRGLSAASLLPAAPPRAAVGPATRARPVQMYAIISGEPYDRLSDDGKMAVKDHKKDAWAEPANMVKSNKVLAEINALAKIEELAGSDVTVAPPDGSAAVKLKKFRMVNRATGAEAKLRDDCGSACQEMLGANAAGYKAFVARNKRGTTEEFTKPSKYERDDNAPGGLVSTTERLSGEIYIRIFAREFNKSLSRVDAVREWDTLSASEKDRLSRKYGINKYAVPAVGQGITIGSERDMPGGDVAASGGGTGFNFHFGLNLMSSDHDYITLEDYASSGVDYYFDMYGPQSKGQSWAEASTNVDALGAKTTTLVVQHPESLNGIVNKDKTFFEADPGKPKYNRTLAKDTKVTIIRKGHSWMKVKVTSGARSGEEGWILNKFFTDT